MNRRTSISDFTAKITGNYVQQLSCEPFCGLYEDSQNWSISAAIKDGDSQYSITCYYNRTYDWFLHKDKNERIMISPDYWCAAVLAAISVMMFEDLNIVFVTEDSGFDSFSWAERCSVSDGLSLIQNEPANRFFIVDGKALGHYEKPQIRQFLGEEDNLRILIIDAPENECQWEEDSIIIEHTISQAKENSFSSFLLSTLEDSKVKSLSEETNSKNCPSISLRQEIWEL